MQLRAYLKLAGLTYATIAERMGYSQAATVQRHAEGIRRPDAIAVEKYRQITNGAVTAQDWHELALQAAGKPSENPTATDEGECREVVG